MPNRTKQPASRSSEIVAFKARPAVRAAIGEMARQRGAEAGDDSITGLLTALVFAEAHRRGVVIAPEPEPVPAKAPTVKKGAKKPAKR